MSAAMALGIAVPQLADSAPREDPRVERERVRAERAQVAAEIDTSKASLAEIDAALQTLEENVRAQEAALARAEDELARAEQDVADAEAEIDRLDGEVVVLRQEIRRRAVDAFVHPEGEDALTVLDTEDVNTAADRQFYLSLQAQDDADVADRLDGALADMDFQRRKATEARELAESKRTEQAERTESVRAAKAQKEAVAADIEATIDSQVARSVELAKTDRELSAKIAKQQAELVARLAAQKAAQEEAAAKAAAAAAAQRSAPTQAPAGGERAPLPPVSSGGGGVGTGGISLCTVGGITVNCQIEGQLAALLNAARADGLSLSGGGYRDPQQQIYLRQQHCGSSYYAIYQMPSSSCSPPTAPPGRSQHEIGLAIDFSNCSSRGTACYQWLAGNASSFGFYNLPSEPWHWSTTGS